MKDISGMAEELKTAAQLRAAFYGYFSRVFREPVGEDFIGLTEQFLPHFEKLAEFLRESGDETANAATEAAAKMKLYAEKEKNAPDKSVFLDDLNRRFTSLYLIGSTSVPNCASVYLSADKLMKSEPWEAVRLVYARRGFKMPEGFNEPEDHIAAELLYLKKINDLIVKLAEDGSYENLPDLVKEEKEFADKHVIPWAADFADFTERKAETLDAPLYSASAGLLKCFLKYDSELSAELAEELDKETAR